MPPFKLEVIKTHPNDFRVPRLLHCKKEYNPLVKITDWNLQQQYEPVDTNPYNPECFRLHNSHYDRLGTQDQKVLVSETHEALKNGAVKAHVQDPHKYLVNASTFNKLLCNTSEYIKCPQVCSEYTTTMQSSYQPPWPCEVKPLIMPTQGNHNKLMANKEESKFLDDNFKCFTQALQKVKGFRHASYSPFTGTYTDGSIRK